MAFYLSPLVAVIEQDFSATVQAVAASVAAIVLENTERGQEMTKTLITNTEDLIRVFGKPTNNKRNYLSMLTAAQALTRMNILYCTAVKPEDATFAGLYTAIEQDPVTGDDVEVIKPFDSDLNDPDAHAYNLASFTSGTVDTFTSDVYPEGFADFIALSRGE
jgi:hypothetical protein